jgi:hypothetical protein
MNQIEAMGNAEFNESRHRLHAVDVRLTRNAGGHWQCRIRHRWRDNPCGAVSECNVIGFGDGHETTEAMLVAICDAQERAAELWPETDSDGGLREIEAALNAAESEALECIEQEGMS